MGCSPSQPSAEVAAPLSSPPAAAPAAAVRKAPDDKDQIFLSYRKADCGQDGDGTAVKLKDALEGVGYTVFLDQEGLAGGDNWGSVLQAKVEQCEVFVALVSAGYEESKWCKRELNLADAKNKAVIPLWHSGEYPPASLQMLFQELQSIPSGRPFKADDLADVVARLLAALTAKGCMPLLPPPSADEEEDGSKLLYEVTVFTSDREAQERTAT